MLNVANRHPQPEDDHADHGCSLHGPVDGTTRMLRFDEVSAPAYKGGMSELIRRVQRAYPQVFLACHVRHSTLTRDHGMSERDASVLAHLDELAPVTVTALARHLGVGAPTVTEAIDRLERRGVVERRRGTRDRRRVELRLTALGLDRMQRSSVLDHARVGEVLAAISPRQRAAAVRGLEVLAAGARKVMTAEPRRKRS